MYEIKYHGRYTWESVRVSGLSPSTVKSTRIETHRLNTLVRRRCASLRKYMTPASPTMTVSQSTVCEPHDPNVTVSLPETMRQ